MKKKLPEGLTFPIVYFIFTEEADMRRDKRRATSDNAKLKRKLKVQEVRYVNHSSNFLVKNALKFMRHCTFVKSRKSFKHYFEMVKISALCLICCSVMTELVYLPNFCLLFHHVVI